MDKVKSIMSKKLKERAKVEKQIRIVNYIVDGFIVILSVFTVIDIFRRK